MDGGQLDAPELTIQAAREQILETPHMEKGRRLLQDYDAVMDKVAEAEKLSADHRPSTPVSYTHLDVYKRQVHTVLYGRDAPASERGADCGVFRGDLEAFP